MNKLLTNHDGNPPARLASITQDSHALSAQLAGKPGGALTGVDKNQFESAEVDDV
ncbi:hypothetical protein [Rhodococcus sp. ACPA1]|uniref:hypothetical protein n=1 Tax=Rhodococcus sp. ACPA1 TaxID=2028572 RepID=UPI0015CC9A46|nr:hypothetical protein [Rhodococcus sp. ACPA1]